MVPGALGHRGPVAGHTSGGVDAHDTDQDGPDIVMHPPLLFAGPLLWGLVLDRVAPLPDIPRWARRLGVPILAVGLVTTGWFARTMRRAGTPVDPRKASTALVTDGPFGYTRNPGYLGFGLVYAGVSLLTNGRWSLVALPAVVAAVDRGVILGEERYLAGRFGTDYDAYRRRVRRWV
jgi:protein-S-isoprenylcysteine O-methyltransferase Ste14